MPLRRISPAERRSLISRLESLYGINHIGGGKIERIDDLQADLAVFLQRDAAAKDHDAVITGIVNAEQFAAALGCLAQVFGGVL